MDGNIKVKDGGRLEVQDGIYSADVSSYCAKGYHVRKAADGMYVVESHSLEMTEATEATCTEDGNIAYWYCDVCKAYFGDTDAINKVSEEDLITPATGHKYIDGKCKCGAEEPKEEQKPENPKEEPKDEQKPEEPTGEQDDPKNGTEEIIPEESATGEPDADAEKNFEIDEVAGVYVQGSGEPFYLRGNGEFTDFKDVKVDGELVDEQYYSVTEGSTIITFTTAYLDSLEPGKHYAEMIWTTGTAEIEFVIAAAPEKNTEENKKIDSKGESKGIDTGDMSSLYLWLVTAFVASVTLMFTYCIWRKRIIK